MESEEFSKFLRGWLDRHSWNVPQLARASGIADAVIRRWLLPPGVAKLPSNANLRKLAPVLEVPEDQLFRMCGYLAGDVGEIAEGDPDIVALKAVWRQLPEWRRRAIRALAQFTSYN